MNSWIIFGGAFIVTILILGAFRAIRARVIAKKAGIVKTCVSASLVIPIVFSALFVFYGFNRLNESKKYARMANQYEMILRNSNYGYSGNGYQQAAEKLEKTSVFNTDNISHNIKVCRDNAKALKSYAVFLFALAFSELIAASGSVWYITEYGIVLMNFKYPEPFYAVVEGKRIVLHYTARVQNFGTVKSFKATPENMQLFAQFMAQGAPQYPVNPQYPQYPVDPHFPQAPQYPVNSPYQQKPQVQQPQNPNDQSNQNYPPQF